MEPRDPEGLDHASGMGVQPMTPGDLDEMLDALNDAFGGGFDRRWFEWKHRSGPWGPSRGWVARDAEGLIGVYVFLPWEFRHDERIYRALRACDVVTVPRARGMTVLRMVSRTTRAETSDAVDLYYGTPNDLSRPVMLRMGYKEWTRVSQRVGVVLPRKAPLRSASVGSNTQADKSMRTARSEEYLDWRYRRCPQYQYRVFGLDRAESPNGIAFRIRSSRRRRMLVIAELWGSPSDKKTLVKAAAAEAGTSWVWAAVDHAPLLTASVARAETVVGLRNVSAADLPTPRLSLGDIEDVL